MKCMAVRSIAENIFRNLRITDIISLILTCKPIRSEIRKQLLAFTHDTLHLYVLQPPKVEYNLVWFTVNQELSEYLNTSSPYVCNECVAGNLHFCRNVSS